MGLKMKKAKFKGEDIEISASKDSMRGNLYCTYCNVPITYVAGHVRKMGDRDIYVKPYFRLVDEKRNPHERGCEYITSNIVKKIFADISDEGLATFRNNKYITRLHIITENFEKEKQGVLAKESKNHQLNKSEKKYIKNNEQPAYLQTIKKIVELKEALDNDKELIDLVTLQFYNEYKKRYDEIKWKDFYADYNLKQYEHIYRLIESKSAFHPICFSGEIKEVKGLENRGIYIIKFYSIKQSAGEYLSLSITTKSEEVFDYASKLIGKKVVIYGCNHFIGKTNESEKNNRKTIYRNFTTQINVKTQIFVLE